MWTVRPSTRRAALASFLALAGCGGSEDLSKSTIPPGESPTEKLSKTTPPTPIPSGGGGGGGAAAPGGNLGLPR